MQNFRYTPDMENVAKMGRPTKYKGAPPMRKKFLFRCFQEDIDAFKRKAKSLGMKTGDWAREELKRLAKE